MRHKYKLIIFLFFRATCFNLKKIKSFLIIVAMLYQKLRSYLKNNSTDFHLLFIIYDLSFSHYNSSYFHLYKRLANDRV